FVVAWGNSWWPAEALATDGDKTLIHYTGYGPESDEWVAADRTGVFSKDLPAPPTQPAQSPLIQGTPAKGELLVEWGERWWPSDALRSEGDRVLIHYKGYGPEWDEWVTSERLATFDGEEPAR